MLEVLEAILFSTLDYAPALIFAALGAVLSERSGIVNIGVEGMMRVGAFAAAVAALFIPTGVAVWAGMLAGAALASIHAYLSIRWRSDQATIPNWSRSGFGNQTSGTPWSTRWTTGPRTWGPRSAGPGC